MKIRKATIEDCKNIYEWRNHEINRQFSHNTDIIPYEWHVEWFTKKIDSPITDILIGSTDENIGVIRFDYININHALISIYLVPGKHGKGLGKELLKDAIKWLKNKGDYNIKAEILPENIASLKIFAAMGFKYDVDGWYFNV